MEVLEDREKTGIAESGSEGAEQASSCTNVNETFERDSSFGPTPNMVFYFRDIFGFQIVAASIIFSVVYCFQCFGHCWRCSC